jgi:hypothetical protein
MFPTNTKGDAAPSLNRDEIQEVRIALAEAIDSTMLLLGPDDKIKAVEFLLTVGGDRKLIYILGAAKIRELLENYVAKDPCRSFIEDLTARFAGFLPNQESLGPKLISSLVNACGCMNGSTLLPKDILDFTVSPENIRTVLTKEAWLVPLVSIVLYYNTAHLLESFKRVGMNVGGKGAKK